ncbi:MAG: glycosyltransferase [Chloroflexi bacterium]|nr:glycosyltransferase [Chloroflexota bacterium]MBU1750178.1 glycosyltransferase [Chloroflexota bacterium]
MFLVEALYILAGAILSIYGLNSLFLTLVYWFRRRRAPAVTELPDAALPTVTVQLPVYNEQFVIERLVAAACALDYPPDRLQIQVLDDSTDETQALAAAVVQRYQQSGFHIQHLHRRDRVGFKAGALQAGLAQAQGELVAILDADFVPPPDFLRRTVSAFADAQVGCVQARWAHLNDDYSMLTRAQALGLDGYFAVEQTARYLGGTFLCFNGTAGLWRRTCIEDAGGWQADTLTEDLDLSYRAQLRGWRFVYRPDVAVPGELPVQMDGFKRQQSRWAAGGLQCARKILPQLWRSAAPLWVKVEETLYLTRHICYPLILFLALCTVPMVLNPVPALDFMVVFLLAALGAPLLYLSALVALYPRWWMRLPYLPLMMLVGTGISLNNSRALWQGWRDPRMPFLRTPKFGIRRAGERWSGNRYALPAGPVVWAELALAGYVGLALVLALWTGQWALAPWLAFYALGFAYVAGTSLWQTRQITR